MAHTEKKASRRRVEAAVLFRTPVGTIFTKDTLRIGPIDRRALTDMYCLTNQVSVPFSDEGSVFLRQRSPIEDAHMINLTCSVCSHGKGCLIRLAASHLHNVPLDPTRT